MRIAPALMLLSLAIAQAKAEEASHSMMQAMGTMQQRMKEMKMSGDTSRDFAMMMLPHHEAAVAMAEALLSDPKAAPQLRRMAQEIISSQSKEIAELQQWLKDHPPAD